MNAGLTGVPDFSSFGSLLQAKIIDEIYGLPFLHSMQLKDDQAAFPGFFNSFNKNTLMLLTTSKLPRFMEHLSLHYRNLYTLYTGRLIELFPCFDGSLNNLAIAEDKKTTEEQDNFLYKLWKQFS